MDGSCHECRILLWHFYLTEFTARSILMDINLPDKSGIDLCKEVKEKYPSVFIIGSSAHLTSKVYRENDGQWSIGVCFKECYSRRIVEAITKLYNGKTYLSFEAGKTLQKIKNRSYRVNPPRKRST